MRLLHVRGLLPLLRLLLDRVTVLHLLPPIVPVRRLGPKGQG
ncbi:MAG: hypothetical protein ACREC5_02270 [Thermoplasmata archaeon]